MHVRNSPFTAVVMNLCLPGLGHIYWREYLFGVFVFLVMLIAVTLFFVSFFLSLSFWPKALLLMLPIAFYAFSFVDLLRVVKTKRPHLPHSTRSVALYLAVGLAYQLGSPVAPLNFSIRNFPETFVVQDSSLSPLYSQGDLLKASHLAYTVDIFFLDRPILHSLPKRYDIVRFVDNSGQRYNGLVLGLPNEEIQMVDGVLVVNGLPEFREPAGGLLLHGDCPLTLVDGYAILVATLNLGRVDQAYLVPLSDVIGKVDRLF